ncbi:MAG: zinc ABC transporter substrate-binding protein [Ruminococcus sp.]|nr:zinc ABC transporter substrate-binding protein [Ruminococcus sp.]
MLKRKFIPALLCLTLTAPLAAGCTKTPQSPGNSDKISVVCTIFPQYDWAKQVIGENENVDLTLLVDNGTDFHSYQPGTDDIVTISSCDVLVYVGGSADSWIEEALVNAANPDMIKLNLTEIMGGSLKTEACINGEEDHDHEHDHEEAAYDEHVWLSLKNAMLFTNAISSAMCTADGEHAEIYQANAQRYFTELQEADAAFTETVQNAERQVLLFGDRFPFRYLTEDYGLTCYAAFPGCSAETDASFETIVFLAGKMDEHQLPAVCTIDGSDSNIADAVISNTADQNQNILTLNSMQSVSREQIDSGITYLSIMEENLAVLSEALN